MMVKSMKVAFVVAGFFVFLQFSTVLLFNQMLLISANHGLTNAELVRYQELIMRMIVGSCVIFGALCFLLMVALVAAHWPRRAPRAAAGSPPLSLSAERGEPA